MHDYFFPFTFSFRGRFCGFGFGSTFTSALMASSKPNGWSETGLALGIVSPCGYLNEA